MPFQTVAFHTKNNAPPTALISYMESTGRGKSGGRAKSDAKPRLMITLPTTICGTSKAETYQLLVGTKTEAGKIRLKGCVKGSKDPGVAPTQMKHAFKWNFGYVPALGDDHFEGERCRLRKIGDDEFEIDVPASWFDTEKAS